MPEHLERRKAVRSKSNEVLPTEVQTVILEKRITIQRGPARSRRIDGRAGFQKLKNICLFLRELGYKDGDKIPYSDVEYAIVQVTQGLDKRTIRKYLHYSVEFGFLKPIGRVLQDVSRVTIKQGTEISQKQYHSKKGHSCYVFGVRAPHFYQESLEPSLKKILHENVCVR
jgi:hypothetical protein